VIRLTWARFIDDPGLLGMKFQTALGKALPDRSGQLHHPHIVPKAEMGNSIICSASDHGSDTI
jgi:hypothetical protein